MDFQVKPHYITQSIYSSMVNFGDCIYKKTNQ